MLRERRCRTLLNLLLNLPRTSLLKEAMSQDEEFYEQMLSSGTGDADVQKVIAIRYSEFSPEVEALYSVIDRLGDVVSGLVGLGGKKPKRITPMKRPETAAARVARRRQQREHDALVARVLPKRS
jgi:hypothetical protein